MPIPTFPGAATLVGSFPHLDVEDLVAAILGRTPELAAWPQLPARDFRETLFAQFSEGLPGVVVDCDQRRIFFRTDATFTEQLEGFARACVTADVDRFAMSRAHALGLHVFMRQITRLGECGPRWVKGQVTGPVSFAMGVNDENDRPLARTPELYEIATAGMAMKARWMARTLRSVAKGALIMLDEPCLCLAGSGFATISRDKIKTAINGAAAAIHAENAVCGLHCCGNTDWSLVLETDIDVVNFDAHRYFQGLSNFSRELHAFAERGGLLAWGCVPTSGNPADLETQNLLSQLKGHVQALTRLGLNQERLLAQSLLTPACGLGTRSVAEANRVFDALTELALAWRSHRA